MNHPVPRDAFARLYADADPERRLSLLAALFAARGWDTAVDDGVVRAECGGTVRRVVPAPDAGDGDVTTAVDAGDGDEATAVDADAAREALLYALAPEAADDLLERHLGRPARSPEYDAVTVDPSDGPVTGAAATRVTRGVEPRSLGGDAPRPTPGASGAGAGTPSPGVDDAPGDASGADAADAGGGADAPADGAGDASTDGSEGGRARSSALVRAGLVALALAVLATAALGAGVGPLAPGGSPDAAAPATETPAPSTAPPASPATTATATAEPTRRVTTASAGSEAAERYFALRPTCDRPPGAVVSLQVRALGTNRTEGIRVAYRFSSPANKRFTGPFSTFRDIVRSDTYRPLLGYRTVTFERPSVDGDVARQRVTVRSGGDTATYEFALSRQQPTEEHAGCWMTDAVDRVDGSRDGRAGSA